MLLPQVVQGLVIGKLTSHFTEQTLLNLSVFVFAGVGLGMVRFAEKSSKGHFSIMVCRWAKSLLVTGSATMALPSCAWGEPAELGLCKHTAFDDDKELCE